MCSWIPLLPIQALADDASLWQTGRTPADCVRQYRAIGRLQQTKWTKEADDKLRELIQLYGQNWQTGQFHTCAPYSTLSRATRRAHLTDVARVPSSPLTVARALGPGWSANQCMERWTKAASPEIRRGPWEEKEDALLRAAVMAQPPGPNYWTRIAKRMANGRTDASCRERWTNMLDPRLLPFHVWSAEVRRTAPRRALLMWAELFADTGRVRRRRTPSCCC